MIKHDISSGEITERCAEQEIVKGQATAYKRLFWWERSLARIIADIMFTADGSRFIRSVEITDKVEGVAQYVLSAEEIRHSGDVQAELYLYYANTPSGIRAILSVTYTPSTKKLTEFLT